MTHEVKDDSKHKIYQTQASKPNTRKAMKEAKEENRIKWVQVRLVPIWLRVLIVLLLLIVVAIIGVMIGYSYLGDGNTLDVFKVSTWRHIFDIMKGKES